jgi:S-formylglutathione hydrolase FrmB
VSAAPTDTFVAGLSMGGYGALKWALRHPDRFAAAASLSGAVDVERLRAFGGRPEDPNLLLRVLGEGPVSGTPDDLFWLLGQTPIAHLPALWIGCGTEDPLYDSNVRFVEACATAAVRVTTSFTAGGHDWALWDQEIQKVLAWLPLDQRAG